MLMTKYKNLLKMECIKQIEIPTIIQSRLRHILIVDYSFSIIEANNVLKKLQTPITKDPCCVMDLPEVREIITAWENTFGISIPIVQSKQKHNAVLYPRYVLIHALMLKGLKDYQVGVVVNRKRSAVYQAFYTTINLIETNDPQFMLYFRKMNPNL
jgi:hypothetical protein